MRNNPGTSCTGITTEAPWSGERPANTVLNPTFGITSRLRCSHGWRRFASHNSTRLPCLAKRMARFQLKKLFPSPASGLVTSTDRGGAPLRDNIREVRSERSDSTNRERGLSNAGSDDFATQLVPPARAAYSFWYGSTQIGAGPNSRETSRKSWILVSVTSRSNAARTPTTNPNTIDPRR